MKYKLDKEEKEILDAFERVLLRDGAHKISVMSISREAGVAKTLIYKYFDGLSGLIKTWINERHGWPDLTDLYADDLAPAFADNDNWLISPDRRSEAESGKI